ncbi:MAG: hypothetical protein OXI34_06435 [Chloroflexota bacterium]|nr:hypothetical protein [Chloroflexota bacterium]MDE2945743.1 hypothetical protein [Chloroflexota bacterium]
MATEQSLDHEGRISALEAGYQHLATKADLANLRLEFEKSVNELKSDMHGLRTDLTGLQTDLTGLKDSIRMSVGITVAVVAVINVIALIILRG